MSSNKLAIGLGVLGGAAVTYALLSAGITGLEPPRTFEPQFSLEAADSREAQAALPAPGSAETLTPSVPRPQEQLLAPARGNAGRGGPVAELRSLLERDPRAAFAEALRIADAEQRPGPLFGVLADWGGIDRDAALAAALELAEARGEQRGLAFIQSALRTADVAEAQKLFRDAERFPSEQARQLRHVTLRKMSTQDPELAARELAQVQSREARAQLARIMAEDFAAHDAHAGLEWARGLAPPVAGVEATMLAAIARSNPSEAIELAAKSKDPNGVARSVQRIVDAALDDGRTDVARLADAALRTAGDAGDNRIVQSVTTAWAGREPRAALDWLVGNAGLVPDDLFARTAVAIGERNADLAVAYAGRVPPDLRDDWFVSIAQGYARGNPQAAADWVAGLRGDPAYPRAASTVASSLAAVDAQAAAGLLETTDFESNGVHGAAWSVANEWARKDPVSAAQWSARLPQVVRDEALDGVMQRWLQDDFANARNWVTRSSRGDVRDRLLATTLGFAAAQGRFEGTLLAEFDSDVARSAALRTGIALVAQRDERAAREALYRYVTDSALRAELEALLERRPPQR